MRFLLLLITLFSVPIFAQDKSQNLYKAFDKIVGLKNTDLSYGKLYFEKYRTLDGNHQYFKKNEFIAGEVKYQNQQFYDILLKYDLAEDELIVYIPSDFESRSIVLEKANLEYFIIDNITFINSKEEGLLEVLFSSKKLNLFKKNIKTKKKKLNESYVYYKFIGKNYYLIQKNDNYYPIKNKKDFYKIFPTQKKMINSFYKSNKAIQKNNLDEFYLLLATKLSNIKNQ